ncbi:hypothetical protein B0H14DRAFT_3454992 [Mycena olivaceomarginata]|nr:hypothetical protein B0H14DRAFT_3454992 [Mycena olivaceomarginata]
MEVMMVEALVRPPSFFLFTAPLLKLTLAYFSVLGEVSWDATLGGDDDKTYAAMGVAKTIRTIISAIDSSPEILAQVQEVIILITISFTPKNKIFDSFDNMYDLVDSLTFKLRAISPNLWPPDAADFLEGMLPSLDNFVSYGSAVVKTRPEYQRMLLDIYQTSIMSEQLGDNASSINDLLQLIIVAALSQLDKAETTALRLANLEVLVNAVLYNPAAALHIMKTTRAGFARKFSDSWFAAINDHNKMPRAHDKKLSIMARSRSRWRPARLFHSIASKCCSAPSRALRGRLFCVDKRPHLIA